MLQASTAVLSLSCQITYNSNLTLTKYMHTDETFAQTDLIKCRTSCATWAKMHAHIYDKQTWYKLLHMLI